MSADDGDMETQDPQSEATFSHFIDLSEAARRLPSRPHTCSVWRWCRRGVKARDGSRVYLQHRRIGGKVWTTAEWIDAFSAELTRRDQEHFAEADAEHAIITTTPTRTATQRERSIARAEVTLAEAGI